MPPISGNLDEHGNFHGYTMLKVLPSVSCIKGRRCQLDGCRYSHFNIADLKWQVVEICNMRLILFVSTMCHVNSPVFLVRQLFS